MSNEYDYVIVKIKINKLTKMLPKINHKREKEFLQKHMPRYLHFYDYFLKKLFPFLSDFKENIAWKVIHNGMSFYVSKDRQQDGMFMSVAFQANNKLKFSFYYEEDEEDQDLARESREGRNEDHMWYYVEELEFDNELAKLIVESYREKVKYLNQKDKEE
ncbi:MAG TPA: hypothetical protein VKN64_11990 [Halanaerobiales bacterium]|nr:hypothetical protein [Halanaerobiales bacterium]